MTVIYWCNEKAIKVNYKYGVYQVYKNGMIPIYDSKNTDDKVMTSLEVIDKYIKVLELQGYIHA